jgi:hypothetical protein
MCVGLPITNRAAMSYPFRISQDFNTAPTLAQIPRGGKDQPDVPATVGIQWTTLTPRGYIAGVAGGLTFQRYYMPHGMLMGEEAETQVFQTGIDDRISRAVAAFYEERSPNGFVRERYSEPLVRHSLRTGQVNYAFTDWEATVDGDDPQLVQTQLLSAYGDAESITQARANRDDKTSTDEIIPNVERDFSLFAYRPEGFNMRIPVQLSRRGPVDFLNYQGALVERLAYEGLALFDGRATLSHPMTALEPYVNLLIVQPDPLLGPLADEVTTPEHPEVTE